MYRVLTLAISLIASPAFADCTYVSTSGMTVVYNTDDSWTIPGNVRCIEHGYEEELQIYVVKCDDGMTRDVAAVEFWDDGFTAVKVDGTVYRIDGRDCGVDK